jgi:glycosyltransferase involved in cell wall biosynthesis
MASTNAGALGVGPAMSKVSIILPTYNRARFMRQALDSIRSQTFTDWDLIIVDDGSTDDTPEVVKELTSQVDQSVVYFRQDNGGPAKARTTGIRLARGQFIAFYDSDDNWLPHHLADCLESFEMCPEVDWVYSATRGVRFSDGAVQWESSFYQDGKPRPFLSIGEQSHGKCTILAGKKILDKALATGLHVGLQTSVLRRQVFERISFPDLRIGEDQILALRALISGLRLAFINDVHVVYNCHDDHVSLATLSDPTKQASELESLANAYEELGKTNSLNPAQMRLLNRRVSHDRFWKVGYCLLWQNGRRKEALAKFSQALNSWPWSLSWWKTYVLARIRYTFARS